MVKNLPSNSGNTGSILDWEDSTCLGVTEPVCLEPALFSKRSQHPEKPMRTTSEEPLLPAVRESNEDQMQQK